MKTMKKLMSIVLSCMLVMFVVPMFASAEGNTVLQFNENGKFTIMMFADIQDDENVEETTLQLMNEALDKYDPDLVVYLGDNTVASGYDNQYAAIKIITEPCVSRNIPYSIVFGNHDQEQGVEKEDLLAMYQSCGCLTYDAAPEIFGCGSCNLPVMSSDGTRMAYNLWFIDSNSRNADKEVGGYDYVHEDQVEWYKNTAEAIKAANGGVAVPAINFQHIVVPEVYEALRFPKLPVSVKGSTYDVKGKTYLPIPNPSTYSGLMCEHPCPPNVADGQLDAWLEEGDVVASFFGHDHTNSFTTYSNGIALTTVPTAGCNSYSSDLNRGVGLLTLDENGGYTYELVKMYDMALAEGSNIKNVDGGKNTVYYRFIKLFSELLEKILNSFNVMPIGK